MVAGILVIEPHSTVESCKEHVVPENTAQIRVLIADDDPIARELIRKILAGQPQVEILGEAIDGEETLRIIQQHRPDVLLLDFLMPKLQGMGTLHAIATGFVPVKVIILAASITKLQALEALQLGARGVLPKRTVRKLPECLAGVANGRYWAEEQSFQTVQEAVLSIMRQWEPATASKTCNLSAREMQVLSLVVLGKTNRDIATAFSISEQTVKHHITKMFEKCSVTNRVELVRFAYQHRLFE